MREDRLGVTHDGQWIDVLAQETVRFTSRGEVRLVSRERSQGTETEPTLEPSQEEGAPLILAPSTRLSHH